MSGVLDQMLDQFPFIACLVTEKGGEVVGIVQNVDQSFVNIYEYDRIRSQDSRRRFLELGERWWYESNRIIPVNVFIGRKFDEFQQVLIGHSRKSITESAGHCVNLHETYGRRVKKRRVELVRP